MSNVKDGVYNGQNFYTHPRNHFCHLNIPALTEATEILSLYVMKIIVRHRLLYESKLQQVSAVGLEF